MSQEIFKNNFLNYFCQSASILLYSYKKRMDKNILNWTYYLTKMSYLNRESFEKCLLMCLMFEN